MAAQEEDHLMLVKRIRWMAIGAVVSYASKAKATRDIDRATDALQERLPEPVNRAVQALPGDLPRLGGAAVVAKNNAARTARATVIVTKAAGRTGRQLGGAGRQVSGMRRTAMERISAVQSELSHEIEHERRRLKSDAVRETEGEAAALEALLDLRATEVEPLPEVPTPIDTGRRRHRPALPEAPVGRVQRSYLPPVNAWDRPRRKRSTER